MCHVECAPSARRDATISVTTCSSVPRPPSMDPWPGSTSMLQTSATSKQDTVGSLDTVVRASYRAKGGGGEALGSIPPPSSPEFSIIIVITIVAAIGGKCILLWSCILCALFRYLAFLLMFPSHGFSD